ncbi:hypothetical protein ACWKW6_22890 [Dyadobacter jiangsuensis]
MELIFKEATALSMYHGFCVRFSFLEQLDEKIVGNSYYRVALHADKYMSSTWQAGGTNELDLKWARSLFYSLNMFLREYYNFHKVLPTSGENQGTEFVDGVGYGLRGKMHLPLIYFRVAPGNELDWRNAEMIFEDLSTTTSTN